MTGTRGQTSGTVMGDRATIDGGRSPPTVTSGTGEPSSLPLPSSSPPSDDGADENSSPLPLENARTCPQLRNDCVIGDVADDMGKYPSIFPIDDQCITDAADEHNGLEGGLLAVRPLVAGNERRGGKPQRETDADEAVKRLRTKQSLDLYSCSLHADNFVCKTRRGIVHDGHRRCMHVKCNFMEVAMFVFIAATT